MTEQPRSREAFAPKPARSKNARGASRVRQILGRMARERGYTHEARVLDACCLVDRPRWMGAARLSTRNEDRAGIDVVVESDVGKLFVQVKSSMAGRAHFERRRRKARIAVVVVRGGESPQELLRMVLAPLAELRSTYLKERDQKRWAPKKTVPPKNRLGSRDWVGLRDLLLAVLLSPDSVPAAGDENLRTAMAARSARSSGAALPASIVRDIVDHYPALFSRTAGETVIPTVDLVGAYQLRLGRLWDPPPRAALRSILTLLPAIVGDGPVVIGQVARILVAALNGRVTEPHAQRALELVRRAGGLRAGPCTEKGGPRVVANAWVLDPAQAQSALDKAAEAIMGPFLPVDPASFAAALGQVARGPSASDPIGADESTRTAQSSI